MCLVDFFYQEYLSYNSQFRVFKTYIFENAFIYFFTF